MSETSDPVTHAGRWTRRVAATAVVAVSAALFVAGAPGAWADPSPSTASAPPHAGWDDSSSTFSTLHDVTQAIGADHVWQQGSTGQGVDVAMIDTGVAPVPGLSSPTKVVNGPDVSFEGQNPAYRYVDSYGHGTHLAGIIAGDDGSSGQFEGVAPGTSIVSVKTASSSGAVDTSQIIAAIDWVVQHRNDNGLNIRVLNLAYGTDSRQSYLIDPLAFAVENAWHHGIVVVVSGGNAGTSSPSLNDPATDPYVISVGAADLHGGHTVGNTTVAPFSSEGSPSRGVDLVAPGVSVASLRDPGSTIDDAHPNAVVDTRFFKGSGTSQAAAVTSGAAALLLSSRPDLSPDQVKALLMSTAHPLDGVDPQAEGAGFIDVAAATRAKVPVNATQTWPVATGTGSLEAARGTSHVAINGVELTGEQDIMGNPWIGSVWASESAAGMAWNGGAWNGSVWSGQSWTGQSWTAMTWAGQSWTGQSWTGQSWTGQSWTADGWQGKSWTGQSWTGQSWTGQSWTGQSWTGQSWTTI